MINQLYKFLKSIGRSFNKAPLIQKLFIVFLILLFAVLLFNNFTHDSFYDTIENYDNDSGSNILFKRNAFESKKNSEVYDDLYVKYYDSVHLDKNKYNFEIGKLEHLFNGKDSSNGKGSSNGKDSSNGKGSSNILDVGSGTGYHVNQLQNKYKNYNVTGIDKSEAMINKAKSNYPKRRFVVEDILNNKNLDYNSQTHITCMNKTFYEFNGNEKNKFLDNCHSLLDDNGYLIVHLLDRDKFVPYNNDEESKTVFNPENYNTKIKNMIVKFSKNIEYYSKYKTIEELENGKGEGKNEGKSKDNFDNLNSAPYSRYNDKIKNYATNSVRKNEIDLYMPDIKSVLSNIKNKGFKLDEKITLEPKYRGEYLYVFKK